MKHTSTRGRILFVHNYPTRFVMIDRELLSERWSVREWYQRSRAVNVLKLATAISECDLVFGWFASWHTFLPMLLARLLGKPSVLVVGGYDVANMPEIGYGHQRGELKKHLSRWTMRLATCLLAFSLYSRREAQKNASIPDGKIRMIYLGVPDPFKSLPCSVSRECIALTVGNVDRVNLWRKGHEPFVRAAALLPDMQFVLVGAWKDDAIDHLRSIAPPNVEFAGWVSEQVLHDYYRRASVYVQASLHEGFGMSVAEAMLAGCVPVVTQVGSLPEVVGNAGIYVSDPIPEAVAEGILKALEAGESIRLRARKRILHEFPLEKRRRALFSLVNNLLDGGHG